jgi:2-polyprenyl-3-methyl-5-hydroxy-6-metoxy-1,4-benzoquinol methylase
MTVRTKTNLIVLVVVPLLVLMVTGDVTYAGLFSSSQQRQAKKILKATGIKGGLIVHIGCGDGKLTAALRANEDYIVQGLDSSEKNVEQARKYIQSLGIYGAVSIDKLQGNASCVRMV